ncbi:Hint domain-containing protein [Paenirhodobacter ferrireducens]|nr:Hint domain-containing protein [Sinirhodobacter ferrireducens]
MATYDMWAWYGIGLVPQVGDNDLRSGLNGTTYAAGANFDYYRYGAMQMIDGDNDGTLRDNDADDGSTAGSDRIVTPDGVPRIVNEVALYSNSVLTYTDFNGDTQTWTMTLTTWQLQNGDMVFRINNALNATWPTDFYPGNIVSIQLGTWNGTEYSGGTISANIDSPVVPCFSAGTLIRTPRGEVSVETLRCGDLVLTLDSGACALCWIGARHLGPAELEAWPNLRPIRIRAGALGPNQPERDLVVSPQHRVLVRSSIARRMFGEAEVLVAAKHLLGLAGVEIATDLAEVTYWHFLLDGHHLVFSNGTLTESFLAGRQALKSLPSGALDEIAALFPELVAAPQSEADTARRAIARSRAQRLVERHQRNNRALIL